MFTDYYAKSTRAAGDVKVSDRVRIWDDIYTVTHTSVLSTGMVTLWVSPEPGADGSLPFNPLKEMTIDPQYRFEIASK